MVLGRLKKAASGQGWRLTAICDASLLNTCPYNFKLLSCTFLDISPTFAIPLILSFLILSSLVTPLIHLNTISATYCDFFTAHLESTLVFARVLAPSYISCTIITYASRSPSPYCASKLVDETLYRTPFLDL